MNVEISDFQKQIIRGILISKPSVSLNEEFHLKLKSNQLEYIRWLYFCLRNLCLGEPEFHQNGVLFKMYYHHWISQLMNEFHFKNGMKMITREILDKLSPLGIALWYISNPSLHYPDTVELNMYNFTCNERKIIKQWFEEVHNIYPSIQRNNSWLKFNKEDSYKLWRFIDKYIVSSMNYKISDKTKNKLAYLAGPMEMVPDDGEIWRREYSKELSKIGIRCIIPSDEENKIKGNIDIKLLKTEDTNKYISLTQDIIRADLTFIEASDFFIAHWDGEVSAGTMSETTFAFYMKKPLYLVTTVSIKDIPGWFLSCFTKIFSSLDELIDYLKENK